MTDVVQIVGEPLWATVRKIADKIAGPLPEKAAELRAFADRIEKDPKPSDPMDFIALLRQGAERMDKYGVRVGIDMTLEKFEGDIVPGKKPFETTRSHDEIHL